MRHQDGNNSAQIVDFKPRTLTNVVVIACISMKTPPHTHTQGQPHRRNSVKTTDVMAYARLMLGLCSWCLTETASRIPPMNWKATAPAGRRHHLYSWICRSLTFGLLEELYDTLVLSIKPASPSGRSSFANPPTRSIRYVLFLFFKTQTPSSPSSTLNQCLFPPSAGWKRSGIFWLRIELDNV